MTLTILLLTTLMALLMLGRRRRRSPIGWLALLLVLYAMLGYGWAAQWLLNSLQTHEKLLAPPWKTHNVIVLLGGGSVTWRSSGQVRPELSSYARVFEAARLYLDCKQRAPSCRLLLSGGDPAKNGLPEAQAIALELRQLGVNPAEMILETRSKNTFQNAAFSSEILRTQKFDTVVLVTSGFHMTRAMLFFSHFANQPIAAPADELDAAPSWFPASDNLSRIDIALHEYLGMAQYHVYHFLGWDPARP